MPYCCNGQTRCSLLGSSPFGAQLAECIRQNPSLLSRTCRQLSVKFRLRYFFPVVACWCYFTPSYAACQDFFNHFDFFSYFFGFAHGFFDFFRNARLHFKRQHTGFESVALRVQLKCTMFFKSQAYGYFSCVHLSVGQVSGIVIGVR